MQLGEIYTRNLQQAQDNTQLMRWIMDPSEQLKRFEMKLRGKRWNDATKNFEEIPSSKPIMNELGISKVITFLTPFIDVITSQGNLDEEEIAKIGIINMESFVIDLGLYHKDYGMDPTHIKSVSLLIATQIKIMLSQSKDGAGNKKVQEILKVQENQINNLRAMVEQQNQRVFR